jgi:hypothetical protein
MGDRPGAILTGDPGGEVACPVQVGRAGGGVTKRGGEGGSGEPAERDRPGPDPESGEPGGPEWLAAERRGEPAWRMAGGLSGRSRPLGAGPGLTWADRTY